ncbi:MAG TPA: MFS transporter [Nitrospiraceae bacterium]|nr:MFS transporter [Nitrospiraceae bacterium]
MTAPTASATKIRWIILALLFLVSMVTYIDRVNISVTARQMMPAYGLTDQEMGLIFSSFVIGYALFQIPGGWLADRCGTRVVLTLALIWWSVCTALTAIAATTSLVALFGIVGALAVVRGSLGVGEAVALPAFNRAVADWLPAGSRGFGIGMAIGGIGLGSAITPPLAAWIMVNWRWQTVFYLASLMGLGMALLWWIVARNHPHEHPWTNEAERALIPRVAAPGLFLAVPWRVFARSPTLLWLVASYTCLGYLAYIYMSWFYLYLVNVRGFDLLRGGLYAAAPFLVMLVFCPLGGWMTDRLATRYGVRNGRVWAGMTGMGLAGLTVALGGYVDSPWLAVASLSLGAGWLYFAVGAYWASTTDLSKTYAGTLSGLMNTGANLGGALSPTVTPWLADHWGWPVSLLVAALIALAGALMWLRIDPGKGLEARG